MSGRLCDSGFEGGHVISWQRRDVNLSPDPILELMAVASCRSLYIISSSTQRSPVGLGLLALLQPQCGRWFPASPFAENPISRLTNDNGVAFVAVLAIADVWLAARPLKIQTVELTRERLAERYRMIRDAIKALEWDQWVQEHRLHPGTPVNKDAFVEEMLDTFRNRKKRLHFGL
ncbi:hypothetical protein [Rhizobium leguminosarum]